MHGRPRTSPLPASRLPRAAVSRRGVRKMRAKRLYGRADIKQYIGLPSARAIYQILRSCVVELMRVGIIAPAVDLRPVHALTSQHVDTAELSPDASAR